MGGSHVTQAPTCMILLANSQHTACEFKTFITHACTPDTTLDLKLQEVDQTLLINFIFFPKVRAGNGLASYIYFEYNRFHYLGSVIILEFGNNKVHYHKPVLTLRSNQRGCLGGAVS